MVSQIDFAVALALFFTFVVFVIFYVVNYASSFNSLIITSEISTVAYDFFNSLFRGKGLPSNWENSTSQPLKFGLSGDLHRIPIIVTDTSGTTRNLTINASLTFDGECSLRAWNDSVRVYNDTKELPFQLYNQSFCNTKFLNTSDIAFNLTSAANQQQIIYVYFSGDSKITNTTNNVSF